MTDKQITVPQLTWVFHHTQLQKSVTAWREKLIHDGISEDDADIAINAIIGFLASDEAKANKMVMGEGV